MKSYLQFLFLICLISCATNQKMAEAELDPNFTKTLKIDKTQLQIITPKTELSEKKNGKFFKHPMKREELRNVMLETTKSIFPSLPYVEVPFMYQDAYTINKALEIELTFKKIKAPEEILTKGKRYSILVCTNGYFGDIERGVIYVVLIDNKLKTRQILEHFEYKHSPLQTEKFKRKILKVLESL